MACEVGVHRVVWNNGNGLGSLSLLAAGTASGLCRVDVLGDGLRISHRMEVLRRYEWKMRVLCILTLREKVDLILSTEFCQLIVTIEGYCILQKKIMSEGITSGFRWGSGMTG
jgi:hypothetical protein